MERTAKPTAENLRCSGRGKLSEVTLGWWSGWRLAAIVEAFAARNSNFGARFRNNGKPANSRNSRNALLC